MIRVTPGLSHPEMVVSHPIYRTARPKVYDLGCFVLVYHDVIGFYITVAYIIVGKPIDCRDDLLEKG